MTVIRNLHLSSCMLPDSRARRGGATTLTPSSCPGGQGKGGVNYEGRERQEVFPPGSKCPNYEWVLPTVQLLFLFGNPEDHYFLFVKPR
ncbi:hypothetical protein FKM82_023163 [Ascaphus truei]